MRINHYKCVLIAVFFLVKVQAAFAVGACAASRYVYYYNNNGKQLYPYLSTNSSFPKGEVFNPDTSKVKVIPVMIPEGAPYANFATTITTNLKNGITGAELDKVLLPFGIVYDVDSFSDFFSQNAYLNPALKDFTYPIKQAGISYKYKATSRTGADFSPFPIKKIMAEACMELAEEKSVKYPTALGVVTLSRVDHPRSANFFTSCIPTNSATSMIHTHPIDQPCCLNIYDSSIGGGTWNTTSSCFTEDSGPSSADLSDYARASDNGAYGPKQGKAKDYYWLVVVLPNHTYLYKVVKSDNLLLSFKRF